MCRVSYFFIKYDDKREAGRGRDGGREKLHREETNRAWTLPPKTGLNDLHQLSPATFFGSEFRVPANEQNPFPLPNPAAS